jgi:hypothetical protein
MNNHNDEINIRQTIFHQTDEEFYPQNAIWINSSSTYYINHSNVSSTIHLDVRQSYIKQSNPSDIIEWDFPDIPSTIQPLSESLPQKSFNHQIDDGEEPELKNQNDTTPDYTYSQNAERTYPNSQQSPQQQKITNWTQNRRNVGVLDTKQILQPFGTPLSSIDPTKTLCIVMQNTQYALQLTNDVSEQIQIINNIKELDALMLIR